MERRSAGLGDLLCLIPFDEAVFVLTLAIS